MGNILNKIKRMFIAGWRLGYDVDYNTAKELLGKSKDAVLIDVRSRDEYEYFHLDNAINIPMQLISEKIQTVVTGKQNVIVVYCEYGGRSKKVADKLRKMGYVNVYNLEGGIRR